MLVRQDRKFLTAQSTIAELRIDRAFVCWTLEDPVRAGLKVPGMTAIPALTYVVEPYASPKHGRVPRFYVIDAEGRRVEPPGFTFIEFHPGNDPSHTLGCVLPGLVRKTNRVERSREAFAICMTAFERAWAAKDVITWTISNPPGWRDGAR